MNILFVMSDLFYSGAEHQIRNIISAVRSENHNVFVAKGNIKTTSLTDQDKTFLAENHIDEDRVCNLFSLNKGLMKGILSYLKNILPCVRSNRIDVVFVYDKFGILMTPVFFALGVKVLYSERNSGEVFQKHWLYRFLFRRFKPILTCNSDFAKTVMEQAIRLPVKKINNVVDVPQSYDSKKDQDADVLNILVSARLSPEKNQLIVVKALESLKIDKKVIVNFAGNVQDESYAALVREKIENNSNENVSYNFLGYVKDKESLYAFCDCVILPSLTEGTPNVVLESFARRVPVLASDIPQNRVLFRNKGFLFDPSSARSLVLAFEKFLAMEEGQKEQELEVNYAFVRAAFGKENVNEYVKLMQY